MVKLGYLYDNEAAALAARDLCDTYYGCPNSVAVHWVSIEPWGDKWVIMYNETLPVVLGSPVVLPQIEE